MLVNKKLTFARYDKIGGLGSRAARVFGDISRKFYAAKFVFESKSALINFNEKTDHLAVRGDCGLLFSIQKLGINIVRKIGKPSIQLAGASCKGAILIEFAVCMPILLILLFYIHDLVKLKRYHSQTEFVAQQMANILQNISQKRSNKAITANDIRYAASLAYLSVFPGKTRFLSKTKTSDLGYNPLGYIYCIRGNSDSKASVLWARRFHAADDNAFAPDTVVFNNSNIKRTNVKNLSEASPSDIYPALKINSGEIKIIIECAIHYSQWDQYFFSDGRCNRDVSPSQAFGLRLHKLSPPTTRDGNTNDAIYFHSAVIFTPKPGLFSETAPA